MTENLDETAVPSEGTERHAERESPPAAVARPTKVVARSTLRRAPRFGRFILAGVVAAALLAALAAVLSRPVPFLGRGGVFLIVLIGLAAAGALIGGLLAVLADRRSARTMPQPAARSARGPGNGVEPGLGE